MYKEYIMQENVLKIVLFNAKTGNVFADYVFNEERCSQLRLDWLYNIVKSAGDLSLDKDQGLILDIKLSEVRVETCKREIKEDFSLISVIVLDEKYSFNKNIMNPSYQSQLELLGKVLNFIYEKADDLPIVDSSKQKEDEKSQFGEDLNLASDSSGVDSDHPSLHFKNSSKDSVYPLRTGTPIHKSDIYSQSLGDLTHLDRKEITKRGKGTTSYGNTISLSLAFKLASIRGLGNQVESSKMKKPGNQILEEAIEMHVSRGRHEFFL